VEKFGFVEKATNMRLCWFLEAKGRRCVKEEQEFQLEQGNPSKGSCPCMFLFVFDRLYDNLINCMKFH